MDIKLKKSKAFVTWLCFFIGLNIIVSFAIGGFSMVADEGYTGILYSIKDIFKSDIKDTRSFKHTITNKFDRLAKALTDEKYLSEDYKYENAEPIGQNITSTDGKRASKLEIQEIIEREFYNEGENLIYYAENFKTGVKFTNSKTELSTSEKGFPSMPKEYNYYFYFDGEKFIIENAGIKVNIYDNSSTNNYYNNLGYSNLMHWGYLSKNINDKMPELKECRIFLVVKKDLISNRGSLYQIKKDMQITKWVLIFIVTLFLFGLTLFVISIMNRDRKREFDKQIAKFLGKFWFEVKGFATIIICTFIFSISGYGYWTILQNFLEYVLPLAIICWWFYLILVDMLVNKRKFFTHNSINSLIKVYRSFESKKPFQKAMTFRLYMLIGVETILIFLAGILSIGFLHGESFLGFLFLIIVVIGIYLIYRYVKRYNKTVLDIGELVDGIQAIKNGDIKVNLQLDPDADMYNAAQNLNCIKEGMSRAVEDRIKSERTKVELITNVSHDLKTPLTSIISYVDLLSKEDDLPDHVKDYIKILQQKSDRLKALIVDLFDLAKATSGEINVDYEKLDLGKLVQQTLGDLDEEISNSKLTFKVNIPEQPIFIMSDGKKLYRIFLNLISNTLKYSLTGSRVYIDLILSSSNNYSDTNYASTEVTAIIKNIANYEMNFSKDEILERFVRGDEARSSEGSGLGLAIAQNFTHVCGGNFDITIDGDMFKVKLTFTVID